MTRTRWIWLVLAILYAAFFSWYTSFGGPLSDEEIDRYVTLIAEREDPPPPERLERLRRFLEEDPGDEAEYRAQDATCRRNGRRHDA